MNSRLRLLCLLPYKISSLLIKPQKRERRNSKKTSEFQTTRLLESMKQKVMTTEEWRRTYVISPVTTVTKRNIVQKIHQSFRSQKTSIGLGNLHVYDWCKRKALVLEHILSIYHPVRFKKDANKTQVQAFIDSGSEVIAIYLTLVKELGFSINPIDVEAWRIDGTTPDTYKMLVIAFSVMEKANRVWFFKETFLLANVSPEIVLEMLFLTLSVANVDFSDWEL